MDTVDSIQRAPGHLPAGGMYELAARCAAIHGDSAKRVREMSELHKRTLSGWRHRLHNPPDDVEYALRAVKRIEERGQDAQQFSLLGGSPGPILSKS